MTTGPDIETYTDPVAFVRDWVAYRRGRGEGVTFATLALELGERSRAAASDVLHGRRVLRPAQARRWAPAFGFTDGGARFVALVEREHWRRKAESSAWDVPRRYAAERATELAEALARVPTPAPDPTTLSALGAARRAAHALETTFARRDAGLDDKALCFAAVVALGADARLAFEGELTAMVRDAGRLARAAGSGWTLHVAAFRVSEHLGAAHPAPPAGADPVVPRRGDAATARAFLAEWIAWRNTLDPGYRTTDLARAAGFTDTRLVWKLVHGTRRITPALARHLGPVMNLEPEETALFLALARHEEAGAGGVELRAAEAENRARHVRDRLLDRLSGWAPLVIRELVTAGPASPDPGHLAALLRPRMEADEVANALAALAAERLLDSEGRPIIVGPGPGSRSYYRALKRLEADVLERAGAPAPGLDTFLDVALPPLDPAAAEEWFAAWRRRLRASAEGRPGPPEHVFQLCVHVFPDSAAPR